MAEAEDEVENIRGKDLDAPESQALTDTNEWLERVRRWEKNMLDALCEDSVLAPGASERRWLLYLTNRCPDATGNDSIRCFLCRKCAYAFSKKDGTLANGPAAYMPHLCRARGLWGGPEPKEIADLTYAEWRAIQLVRL